MRNAMLCMAKSKPLDFWIKWAATIMTLIHCYMVAHGVSPYYKVTGVMQASIWLWLGILWRQPSFILLNSTMLVTYITGLMN